MSLLALPLDDVLVGGQIGRRQVVAIAGAGVRCIVNNRPDEELRFLQPTSARLARACREAGADYLHLPFADAEFSLDQVEAFRRARREARGPVFAFCRTGYRSALLWAAAAVADGRQTDDALAVARAVGIDLATHRDRIETMGLAARG